MKLSATLERGFNFNFDEGGGPDWMSFTRGGRGRLGITYTEILETPKADRAEFRRRRPVS